jgi:hypothetical protein
MPGLISPRSKALFIMFSAGRSFTLPPGLFPSSLAKILTFGFGLSLLNSASGVFPIKSNIPGIKWRLIQNSNLNQKVHFEMSFLFFVSNKIFCQNL